MYDHFISINREYDMSIISVIFLLLLMTSMMFKLKWAYSPSVGEDLKEIKDLVQELKTIIEKKYE